MHDPISTRFISEEIVHGSSAPAHLPKGPLQDISSPDGPPELFFKIVIVETAEEVLPHTPDCPFLFNKPSGLPAFETPEGFLTAVRLKDELSLLKTVRAIDLFGLYGHIAHLVGHTALCLDEGIDTPYGLEQCRVTVGDNELEAFAIKPPTLQIREKSPPRSLILHLGELEGEDLLVSLTFTGPLTVNGKATEHDLLCGTDLPNLLADAIQKEKLHRVINGFVLEALKLLIQRGQGGAHCLGTDLLAIELFGDPLELTGTHTIEKQSANGGIHISTTPFVAVKDAEFHAPWFHSRYPNLLDGTESAQKISHVMTVPVAPTTLGSFVLSGTDLTRKLLSQEIFNERFDKTLYS